MRNIRKIIAFLLAAFATASIAGAEVKRHVIAPKLESFEFLGCAGDWSDDKTTDSVRRLTSNDRVTFLVRHPATCGLEGRNPRVTFASGKLDLSYELYSPNDSVIYCECEYWAKFTFDSSAMMLAGVTFEGRAPELLGDWPNEL
jgi:hypothetical protein